MNGNSIRPVCDEDPITDDLLEAYAEEVSSSVSPYTACETRAVTTVIQPARGEVTPFSPAAFTSSAAVTSSGFKSFHRNSGHRTVLEDPDRGTPRHAQHPGSTSHGQTIELLQSEITSDDSGDFAFLTSDVNDAETYDLLRHYMLYSKQQEKSVEGLEEECARLEEQQQQLHSASVATGMIRGVSITPAVSPLALAHSSLLPETGTGIATATTTTTSSASYFLVADDEFGEAHINPLKVCPYGVLYDAAHRPRPYRYGHPAIIGSYTPVFKDGILHHCTTVDGSWVFYNDSQQYVMRVMYIVGASSVITAGPHGSVRQRASGEFEAEVTVWPQETEVLLVGKVNGFRNQSAAVPVDSNYVNPHTAASTASARAQLNRFAQQSRKSSISLLTAEDVLQCCTGQDSELAASSISSDGPHFVDPDFPPGRTSLYRSGVDAVFLWDMHWRRPHGYLPTTQSSEACLFAGAVLPTDPSPGEGGDTYLCSAASLLANHPMRVVQLFRHPVSANAGRRERAAGAYRVTLSHGGWWTSTLLDSYLPASLKGPDLGRCSHDLRKLWYPLLEKAYAKLHGSYAAIQLGDSLDALQDITGYPTFRFDVEWAEVSQSSTDTRGIKSTAVSLASEQLFTFLEEKVQQRGYLVCLSLPDEGPVDAQAAQMGMVFGMSYAVQQVVRHGSSRLLQIQCHTLKPGSSGMWCGESARWQQDSSLAELCGMVGVDKQKPGSIWLDWSEALRMFEGGGVCCSRWDWAHDCRVRGFFNDGVPSIVLELSVGDCGRDTTPVEAYCILSQEDDRGMPPDNPSRELRPLMLSLSSHCGDDEKDEDDSADFPADQRVRYVSSTDPDTPAEMLNYILGRDTALRVTLQPSAHPYYLVPRSLGNMNNRAFTVGIASSTPVTRAGKLRVRAVRLPDSSPVFHNRRSFSTQQLTSASAVSFQLRGPDGRVHIGCGSSIG
ncbi:hypothetical protein JKF63_03783 [Porcisia hertigi]|uniref:Calpain catalytic domain-containing protein n=1 Tax=Porcisia hertigi TaxID=2761500 RepID=A0A836HR41_9TRYP|nr:hypothetical protein JKF63_03783 [Porcisia hertigi]